MDVAITGIRVLLCVQMTTRSDANEHEADSATDRQCVCLSLCLSLCVSLPVSVCALVDVVHRDVFRASVIVLFTTVSSCVTDLTFNTVRCPCNGLVREVSP